MSEIRVTTVSDTAGTGPVTLTKQSASKAWINFNGSGTVATRDSFNFSTLTDNGTGDYTVAHTNSMANDDFVILANVGTSSTNDSPYQAKPHHDGWSVSSTRVNTIYANESTSDYFNPLYVLLTLQGDLA